MDSGVCFLNHVSCSVLLFLCYFSWKYMAKLTCNAPPPQALHKGQHSVSFSCNVSLTLEVTIKLGAPSIAAIWIVTQIFLKQQECHKRLLKDFCLLPFFLQGQEKGLSWNENIHIYICVISSSLQGLSKFRKTWLFSYKKQRHSHLWAVPGIAALLYWKKWSGAAIPHITSGQMWRSFWKKAAMLF